MREEASGRTRARVRVLVTLLAATILACGTPPSSTSRPEGEPAASAPAPPRRGASRTRTKAPGDWLARFPGERRGMRAELDLFPDAGEDPAATLELLRHRLARYGLDPSGLEQSSGEDGSFSADDLPVALHQQVLGLLGTETVFSLRRVQEERRGKRPGIPPRSLVMSGGAWALPDPPECWFVVEMETLWDGTRVERLEVRVDPESGRPFLLLQVPEAERAALRELTGSHEGERVAFCLGYEVLVAAPLPPAGDDGTLSVPDPMAPHRFPGMLRVVEDGERRAEVTVAVRSLGFEPSLQEVPLGELPAKAPAGG